MKTTVIFIFFTMFGGMVWAEPLSITKTVAKAREQLVQKDRLAAAQTLQKAILEVKRESERNELIKELQSLSSVFLTEEGQKSFELAESSLYSAAAGAEARYEEALNKEPHNMQIILGLVRSRIARGECAGANTALADAEKVNPYSLEKKYLSARVSRCLKLPVAKKVDPGLTGEYKRHGLLLQAQALVEDQKLREAQDMLFKDSKELVDWDMPEVNYWRYKSLAITSTEAVEYAQKYIDQCKSISASLRRQFKLEPRLCLNEPEAEEFIKKSEATK